MRTLLYLITFITVPIIANAQFSDPENWKANMVKKGYKIKQTGPQPVGLGPSEKVLILTVNIPKSFDYEVFTFISNKGEGCLGACCAWVRGEGRYGQDLQWCKINGVHKIPLEDGGTQVKGYFINSSHCDSRQGYMFVAYKE